MKILIVEDNPTDRELLLYILQEKFKENAKFREANSIQMALKYLQRGDIDCVILDLTLPDSAGKETFLTLHKDYSHLPIIVMTNNQNRELALEMIKSGAADYIIKDFTNEEEIFSRILYAYEKKRNSIKTDEESKKSIKKLDINKSQMLAAHQSGQHTIAQNLTIETTSTLTEISKNTFVKIQELSQELFKVKTEGSVNIQSLQKEVKNIRKELVDSEGLSLKSEIKLLKHRMKELEKGRDKIESIVEKGRDKIESIIDISVKSDVDEIKEFKKKSHSFTLNNKTMIILAIISLIGTIATAYFSGKSDTTDNPKTSIGITR